MIVQVNEIQEQQNVKTAVTPILPIEWNFLYWGMNSTMLNILW